MAPIELCTWVCFVLGCQTKLHVAPLQTDSKATHQLHTYSHCPKTDAVSQIHQLQAFCLTVENNNNNWYCWWNRQSCIVVVVINIIIIVVISISVSTIVTIITIIVAITVVTMIVVVVVIVVIITTVVSVIVIILNLVL